MGRGRSCRRFFWISYNSPRKLSFPAPSATVGLLPSTPNFPGLLVAANGVTSISSVSISCRETSEENDGRSTKSNLEHG